MVDPVRVVVVIVTGGTGLDFAGYRENENNCSGI
jgi:hypothetical protein